ncbi:MAG: hypothetical protein PVJ42_03940, partial [bacterium]
MVVLDHVLAPQTYYMISLDMYSSPLYAVHVTPEGGESVAKLLLVEDEPAHLDFYKRLLSEEGH